MRKFFLFLGLIASTAAFSNKFYPTKGGDNGVFLTGSYDTVAFSPALGSVSYVYVSTNGSSGHHVTFINEGWQQDVRSGFEFNNSSYIDLNGLGTGAQLGPDGKLYGFYIHDNLGSTGISIHGYSHDIYMNNIMLRRLAYFTWVKQEVDCDLGLNYPNSTMYNIVMHDCYEKGCQQDGNYWGSTGPTGSRNVVCFEITNTSVSHAGAGYTTARVEFKVPNPSNTIDSAKGTVTLSGGTVIGIVITYAGSYNGATPIPIIRGTHTDSALVSATAAYVTHSNYIPDRLHNIAFYNNYIDSTGRTGWQGSGVNKASSDWYNGKNVVFNNTIKNTGFEFNNTQGTGIFLGGMASNFLVYNNNIDSTWNHGIFSYGVDTVDIYNNVINHTGILYGDSGARDQSGNLTTHSLGTHRNDWLGSIYTNIPFSVPQSQTLFRIHDNICGINTDHNDYKVYVGTNGNTNSSYSPTGNILCNNGHAGADVGVNYSTSCIVNNINPIVNAGSDISITLPTNSTTLNGSAVDPDNNTPLSYLWSRVSGSGNISTPNSANTAITGLTQGTSTYKLTVTDALGGSSSDNIDIITSQPANTAPVANAGSDQTITTTNTKLLGSGSDLEGSITYLWSQLNGPNISTFSSNTIAQPTVSNLIIGVYNYEIAVTDQGGLTTKDTVQITVNSAVANKLPIIVLKSYDVMQSPDNSVQLNGSGSYDPDGNIVIWQWNQVGSTNGKTAILSSANTATCDISSLETGNYTFQLTVTDNSGASVYRQVIVYVVVNVKVRPNSRTIIVQ